MNIKYGTIYANGFVFVDDHNSDTSLGEIIRQTVNGHFDCVNLPHVKCVMYVHDEGHLLNLPINPIATALAGQVISGNVIVIGSHSPSGVYDDNPHSITDEAMSRIVRQQEIMVIRAESRMSA